MHHARQHAETKTRERRYRLAHEAARLIAESGIRDFHQAKLKAAARLGIHDDASLPRNREIEDALREYQRLFQGDAQASELRRRREAALRALDFFGDFDARLVGPVLEGTADANSPVHLQLYTDDADSVPRFLDEHRIPAEPRSRRVRLDRERACFLVRARAAANCACDDNVPARYWAVSLMCRRRCKRAIDQGTRVAAAL